MDYYYKNALNSLRQVGVDLKRGQISNIEAAEKICETLCAVVMYYYGGKAEEEAQAIRKGFEV